jgi:thiaminase/transcriptional activator TenA
VIDLATTSLSASLREHCRGDWETLIGHPFVAELASGTLPLERFRFYIEQDILFLDSYARAIGFASGRASSHEELVELTAQLAAVVQTEIESERALLRRVEDLLGTDPALDAHVEPSATTVAYSSFLLATAARGDALDVMTAMLPCAWSYADIGRRYLHEAVEHPVYSDWLRLFGSGDYPVYVERRLASFDRFAARAAPARHDRLVELFSTATRLERAFWDMAYKEETR